MAPEEPNIGNKVLRTHPKDLEERHIKKHAGLHITFFLSFIRGKA